MLALEEATNPLDYAMASRDQDVMTLVRDALEAEHCALAFQQVLRADMPGQVAFYEGLIRVRDEGGRIIPAHHFMTNIEDTDLGREIDAASLRAGLQMLRRHPRLRLSINVSARSLGDGKWRRILAQHLSRSPEIGERLILEISEGSAMLLPELVVRFMEEMQPRGVAFALDDFGAGLIAFSHLRDFFFDMVKIDRSYVRGIDSNPDNQVLAGALMTVAQQFDMFVVASGVETAEEVAFLTEMGIDCLQGFYTGAPRMKL